MECTASFFKIVGQGTNPLIVFLGLDEACQGWSADDLVQVRIDHITGAECQMYEN